MNVSKMVMFNFYFFNFVSLKLKAGGCLNGTHKERDIRLEPLFPLHNLFIRYSRYPARIGNPSITGERHSSYVEVRDVDA